jgi:hypothetical protein
MFTDLQDTETPTHDSTQDSVIDNENLDGLAQVVGVVLDTYIPPRYACIDIFYALVGCVIAYVLRSNSKTL